MSIPLVNLRRQHEALQSDLQAAVERAMGKGDFILGSEVAAFEEEFAAYCEAKHCVGVGSGLDALTLALKGVGIGPGDEVITTANTFIATALSIVHAGATPVLVDHDPQTYNLDPRTLTSAITSRTKAIVPVHLYGLPADMDTIRAIADEHGIVLIEDAAQAHGARYKGQRCGALGRAASFSFHPEQNLGAMGDGGAVVTDDDDLAQWLRAARHYGSHMKHRYSIRGFSSRLDNLQAAVLRVKLRHLDQWNRRRRELAHQYRDRLSGSGIVLPMERNDRQHVYHLFVVRSSMRDVLYDRLNDRGIGAGLHYPIPIHRQQALGRRCVVPRSLSHADRFCHELISLPLCPFLAEQEVDLIAQVVLEATSEPVVGAACAGLCDPT